MIRTFRDGETRDIFEGRSTKKARRRLHDALWERAQLKMDQIDAATATQHLNTPSNRLQKLRGDRVDEYSIRINLQYRICFRWEKGDAWDVEITDYH